MAANGKTSIAARCRRRIDCCPNRRRDSAAPFGLFPFAAMDRAYISRDAAFDLACEHFLEMSLMFSSGSVLKCGFSPTLRRRVLRLVHCLPHNRRLTLLLWLRKGAASYPGGLR